MPPFKVHADFQLSGDQPSAVEGLAEGVLAGEDYVTLLGATGTGKTFTIAHVIERVQKPTLVIA
ncbi:MAG: DEAD/DEAH box helicase family protein, partial [Actinomycetota bacterium]